MTETTMAYPDAPTKKFGLGEIIVGASGVVLIALMFLPWFEWTTSGITITTVTGTRNPGGDLSAWQFFGGMAYLFLLTALLAIGLAMFRRSLSAGAGTAMSLVVAGLGLVLAGLTLWNIVSHPLIDVDRGSIIIMDMNSAPVLGAFLGVIATLGIAIGGLLSLRSNRG